MTHNKDKGTSVGFSDLNGNSKTAIAIDGEPFNWDAPQNQILDIDDYKTYKIFSERFNAMSFENRGIAADSELVSRIRDLEFLKKRLKENYHRELKWVNDRIKNYKSTLKEDL